MTREVCCMITWTTTNNVRLNSATGYITAKDMLAGLQQEIHLERDRRLETARKQRQIRRRAKPDQPGAIATMDFSFIQSKKSFSELPARHARRSNLMT